MYQRLSIQADDLINFHFALVHVKLCLDSVLLNTRILVNSTTKCFRCKYNCHVKQSCRASYLIHNKLYEFDYSSTFLLFFYTMIRNCKFTYLKKKIEVLFLLINFYRTSFPQFLYNEKIIINFNFLIILTCWII